MSRKTFIVLSNPEARAHARRVIDAAPDGDVCRVSEPNRSLEQNADQWPYLEAFATQLQWPINGKRQFITADDWKDILTCAFRNEQPRVAQGLDGGMVLLGLRTSKMGKKEFSEWLEFLHATAALRGVEPVYKNERKSA